jgi:hypothetical protein
MVDNRRTSVKSHPSFPQIARVFPQGDELGHMNPLACNSAISFLSSANSFVSILYGLLEIGGVPGSNSIRNSMSRSGGIPDNSSGNTSKYS